MHPSLRPSLLTRRSCVVLFIALACTLPALAIAQPLALDLSGLTDKLVANDRVEVVTISGDVVEGRLVALTRAALTLRRTDSVGGQSRLLIVQAADVREAYRLDHRAARGATLGALIGGGAVLAVNVAVRNDVGSTLRATSMVAGMAAAVGAPIGLARYRRVRIYTAGSLVTPFAPSTDASTSILRPRPTYGWDAFWVTGTTSSGPARDLERAMRAAQFDGGQGFCFIGLCLPGRDHPFSRTGIGELGFPSHVGVSKVWRGRISLGGFAGRSGIGRTMGLDRNSYARLNLSYAVSSAGPMVTFAPVRGVRLGAGAAAFITSIGEEQGPDVVTTRRRTSPGAVLEARFTAPASTRVFAALLVQGRLLRRQRVGPYDETDGLTGITASFPATPVRMSHWFIGVGVGARF